MIKCNKCKDDLIYEGYNFHYNDMDLCETCFNYITDLENGELEE
jgi:hypothetical protein